MVDFKGYVVSSLPKLFMSFLLSVEVYIFILQCAEALGLAVFIAAEETKVS